MSKSLLTFAFNTKAIKMVVAVAFVLGSMMNNSFAKESGDDLSSGSDVKKEISLKVFDRAEALRKHQNYTDALNEYRKAITLDPQNFKFYYSRALCFKAIKRFNDMVRELNHTIALNKKYAPAYALLGKHYKSSELKLSANYFAKAAFASKSNKNKQAYFLASMKSYYKLKQYTRVAQLGDRAFDIAKDNNIAILLFAGRAHNKLNTYREAIPFLTAAAALVEADQKRKTASVNFELGYAYLKLKDFESSEKAFAKANYGKYKFMIAELSPVFHYNIALANYKIFNYDAALNSLKKALELQPNFVEAHMLEVKIHQNIAPHAASIAHCSEVIETLTNEKELQSAGFKLAKLQFDNAQYTEALETIIANEQYGKLSRNASLLKAMTLAKQNKNAEAIALIKQVANSLKNNPNEIVKFNYALGTLYLENGDITNASKAFQASMHGEFKNAAYEAYTNILKKTSK